MKTAFLIFLFAFFLILPFESLAQASRGISAAGRRVDDFTQQTDKAARDAVEKALERALQWAVFEPNNLITRQSVATTAATVLGADSGGLRLLGCDPARPDERLALRRRETRALQLPAGEVRAHAERRRGPRHLRSPCTRPAPCSASSGERRRRGASPSPSSTRAAASVNRSRRSCSARRSARSRFRCTCSRCS